MDEEVSQPNASPTFLDTLELSGGAPQARTVRLDPPYRRAGPAAWSSQPRRTRWLPACANPVLR
jgi:hypothetical protein